LIIIEKTNTGFSAYVPDLPGCIATGRSRLDVQKSIYNAIRFHLAGLKEANLPIPSCKTEAASLFIQV
jgi:predicted RNase H-like HicB family nuclease